MPLQVGSKAPDFQLKSKQPSGLEDKKLSSNYGKTNTLVLCFTNCACDNLRNKGMKNVHTFDSYLKENKNNVFLTFCIMQEKNIMIERVLF